MYGQLNRPPMEEWPKQRYVDDVALIYFQKMSKVLVQHTSKLPKQVLKNTKNMTSNSCSVRPEKFHPYTYTHTHKYKYTHTHQNTHTTSKHIYKHKLSCALSHTQSPKHTHVKLYNSKCWKAYNNLHIHGICTYGPILIVRFYFLLQKKSIISFSSIYVNLFWPRLDVKPLRKLG